MIDMQDIKAYSDLGSAYSSDHTDRLMRVAEQYMTTFSAVSGWLQGRLRLVHNVCDCTWLYSRQHTLHGMVCKPYQLM
jgi:hypothetical protein